MKIADSIFWFRTKFRNQNNFHVFFILWGEKKNFKRDNVAFTSAYFYSSFEINPIQNLYNLNSKILRLESSFQFFLNIFGRKRSLFSSVFTFSRYLNANIHSFLNIIRFKYCSFFYFICLLVKKIITYNVENKFKLLKNEEVNKLYKESILVFK